MKEMSLDEIKSCSIGILDFIDTVCKKNQLNYYLCGGTLLGAVRHNGFIPWDDDIDIVMPRNDYERLFEVWPANEQFAVLCHKNTHNFPYAYGKVIDNRTVKIEPIRKSCQLIGVDVDIFPIDVLPDNDDEASFFFKEIAKKQEQLSLQLSPYCKSHTLIRTIAKNIRLFFLRSSELVGITSVDKITKQFDELAQKYNQKETNFCGITTISHYGIREKNPNTNYNSAVYVTFENKQYPAPCGYVDILTRLYGKEHMQLPPVEQRQTHHSYKAYWK
jgi:lipopolysaccharide cholinephosphotransferase